MINLNKQLSRLNEIKSNEDIKALSYAKFPGTHCPLFGVAMIASFIADLAVLVIGTGECTYYSKGFAYGNQKGKDNFYSLVLGKNELAFGCGKQVINALKQIESEDKPNAVMIVTTCVLEIIGEDIESLIFEHEQDFNAKLITVKTEHFKCGSHIPGMERALKALVGIMDKTNRCEKSINILGHRKHGVEKTEVISILHNEGIEITSIIPSNCTVADLNKASSASLNIVTDFTALPMAKEMEKRFHIPFLYFGRHLLKGRIDTEYKKIEEIFGINLVKQLDDKQKLLDELEARAKELLGKKTFIYGNTPMMAFEVSDYLAYLGLEPVFIQVREYYEQERSDMDKIQSRGFNPYIAQIANIAPMQEVYDLLKPDIYLGHENPVSLFKKGIVQITADEVTEKIGYEVPIAFLKKIIYIYEAAIKSPHIPVGMMSMIGISADGIHSDMQTKGKTSVPVNQKGMDEWLSELSEFADDNEMRGEKR